MYKEEEIQGIISKVIEISLEHESIVKKITKKKEEVCDIVPDYNPIYRRSVELAEEMAVHMDSDKFPHKLFKCKAPNEHPEEFAYRKMSYQPVTMPFMDRAMTTINRIWNESNYTITDWKEYSVQEEDQPENYFLKKYPSHDSIISYFRSIVTKNKMKDSNGVRVVKPRLIPIKEDQDGNLAGDQSKLIEPISVVYEADQVIFFEENEYAVIELREKSMVKVGNSDRMEGLIYEFYDDKNIWRITQVGKKIDYEFFYEVYYEHNLRFPVKKLKGRPCQKENYLLYESHLMPAVPNLNIALYNSNTLEMSITKVAFPLPWKYVENCNYEGCDEGYVMGGDEKKYACPKCHGRGKLPNYSPMSEMEVYVGDRLTQGAENLSMPPGGFLSPDMSTLEFRHTKYNKDIEQAFAFLNIDVSNSNVNGQKDTAIGKKIDREELFSFLLLISNELFDLLEDTIDLIGKMRYGSSFEMPVITRPIDFSIRSNEELIEEIVASKTAMVPDIMIQKQLKEYSLSRFNTSKEVTKFLEIVFKTDRLLTLTQEEIVLQKTTGSVLTWEIILHTSIYTYLEQLIMEDEKFLEKDFKDQKELLEKKAKDKEAEIKLASPAPTMDKIMGIADANAQRNNSPKI